MIDLRGGTGTCRLCGFVGPVSPVRHCQACVERALAENPLMAVAVDRAARMLEAAGLPAFARLARVRAGVHALLAFVARCRK